MTTKETAIQIIENLPENSTFEEIMYELYVRQQVERGLKDVEEGRTISHAELKQEVRQWFTSAGR